MEDQISISCIQTEDIADSLRLEEIPFNIATGKFKENQIEDNSSSINLKLETNVLIKRNLPGTKRKVEMFPTKIQEFSLLYWNTSSQSNQFSHILSKDVNLTLNYFEIIRSAKRESINSLNSINSQTETPKIQRKTLQKVLNYSNVKNKDKPKIRREVQINGLLFIIEVKNKADRSIKTCSSCQLSTEKCFGCLMNSINFKITKSCKGVN